LKAALAASRPPAKRVLVDAEAVNLIDASACDALVNLILAAYRDGRFADALTALEKGLTGTPNPTRDAAAQSLLVMTHHRLKQAGKADEALTRARQLLGRLPKAGEDPGDDWHDWLFCHVLHREAEATLKEPPGNAATHPSDR
jgi:tetratricopeptide (TPR) repeat protein